MKNLSTKGYQLVAHFNEAVVRATRASGGDASLRYQRYISCKALEDYICDLEEAAGTRQEEEPEARWVLADERLPEKDGYYITGVINMLGDYYREEVLFIADDQPRWVEEYGFSVYCWLDNMPELPDRPKEGWVASEESK